MNQCPSNTETRKKSVLLRRRGEILSIATGRSGRMKINKPHIFIAWVKNNTEKRTKWSTEPSGF